MSEPSTVKKAIVVGAGLSGLSAATLLHQSGVEVCVLEANDRVGGRLHTIQTKVGWVDVGGSYIGPTQDRMFRIAKDLGVQTYKVYGKPDFIYHYKGKSIRRKDLESISGGAGLIGTLDINNFYTLFDRMAKQVPLKNPWKAPNAELWDRMTMADLQKQILWTKTAKGDSDIFARVNFAAEPHNISLLWALWYLKGAGGVNRINLVEGGAQERKFVGGSQQIPIKMAEKLGSRVRMNQPVIKIEHDGQGVKVHTSTGEVFEGDYVVLGLAPSLQTRIEFVPALPQLKMQLNQKVPMGSVIKCMMYYDRSYWREKGLGGGLFSVSDDLFESPVDLALDDAKPDGSSPCLIGFISGDKALKLGDLTKEERKLLIASQYARCFDITELKNPIHYEEKNWNEDQWSGGCYVGYMPPGVLTTVGRCLRESIGQIHFASTETATVWPGYMEGAVESGERAAREILYRMNKISANEIYQKEPPAKDVYVPDVSFGFVEEHTPSVSGVLKLAGGVTAVVAALYNIFSKL